MSRLEPSARSWRLSRPVGSSPPLPSARTIESSCELPARLDRTQLVHEQTQLGLSVKKMAWVPPACSFMQRTNSSRVIVRKRTNISEVSNRGWPLRLMALDSRHRADSSARSFPCHCAEPALQLRMTAVVSCQDQPGRRQPCSANVGIILTGSICLESARCLEGSGVETAMRESFPYALEAHVGQLPDCFLIPSVLTVGNLLRLFDGSWSKTHKSRCNPKPGDAGYRGRDIKRRRMSFAYRPAMDSRGNKAETQTATRTHDRNSRLTLYDRQKPRSSASAHASHRPHRQPDQAWELGTPVSRQAGF